MREEIQTTHAFGEAKPVKYNLMYKDLTVLEFSADLGQIETICPAFLPYGLRAKLSPITLHHWLVQRATPVTRKNMAFMYMLLGLPRTDKARGQLTLKFGGISINDCFWVKDFHSEYSWKELSPFSGKENWAASERAFGYESLTTGSSDQLKPFKFSPETTLQGNWAKCLVRKGNKILLYKANDDDLREIEIARFGRALGLDVVKYWAEDYEDVPCTVCGIDSTEHMQWITAEEIGFEQAKRQFPLNYSAMKNFDYIVGNSDRHSMNWGWVVDAGLRPLKLTPMYDFNISLLSVNMPLPEQLDLGLVNKAIDYLERYPTTPNIEFYQERIRRLLSAE